MPSVRLVAIVPLLLVAACNQASEKGPERKTAAGEVLGGSISDSMLPLNTVQSQSPPLRESASDSDNGGTPSKNDDKAAGDADAEKPAADASPSTAASASATPQAEN